MSLTYLQYRKVIWVGMGIIFGVFTSVEFLSNLVLHIKHGQTMPVAFGLAIIGTIIYAFAVAAILAVVGVTLSKITRSILTPDTKGKHHE